MLLKCVENANAHSLADALLDAALSGFVRSCERAEPAPGLADAIMVEICALRGWRCVVPPPELREFLGVAAADAALQVQLAAAADRSGFVRLLTQAGAARGFRFLKGEVYALLRCFEIADDGELNDEQLDAVAAAAHSDAQLMWELFRNKP